MKRKKKEELFILKVYKKRGGRVGVDVMSIEEWLEWLEKKLLEERRQPS